MKGFSRAILKIHIESRLLEREGKAITNFADRLPSSELAWASRSQPPRQVQQPRQQVAEPGNMPPPDGLSRIAAASTRPLRKVITDSTTRRGWGLH